MSTIVLAICLHPHIMTRAQAELDRVVGRDRMPSFQDSEHLPYIHAIIKESLRWMPLAPTGIVMLPCHIVVSYSDVIWQGFLI